MSEYLCPHFEDHTQSPGGYIQWHSWAETMSKTHEQSKCDGCGLYVIWLPKAPTLPAEIATLDRKVMTLSPQLQPERQDDRHNRPERCLLAMSNWRPSVR